MAYAQVFDKIPPKITAGTSVSWAVSVPDFPATKGWALTYTMVIPSAQVVIESTTDGDAFLFEIPFSESSKWAPGVYSWQSYVSNGTERYLIDSGRVEVVLDLESATSGHDARSWIDVAIAALRAAIAGRASKTQLVQIVDGVQVQHMTIEAQKMALDMLLFKRVEMRGKWRRRICTKFKN